MAAWRSGYELESLRSTTVASGAFFLTDSMPFLALALVSTVRDDLAVAGEGLRRRLPKTVSRFRMLTRQQAKRYRPLIRQHRLGH